MVEVTDMKLDLQNNDKFKRAVYTMLEEMGEDPDREDLKRTPERVAKAFEHWFGGYAIEDPSEILDRSFPSAGFNDMVSVPKIEFTSHCAHHITIIRGYAHLFYIPNKKLIGLDKLIKLVYMYARRLQTQEVMAQQIGEAMTEHLETLGVYVYIEGQHDCVATRGVENKSSLMVTTYRSGEFKTNFDMENKALKIIEISKK